MQITKIERINPETTFEPQDITIRIETLQDLRELWHRFNLENESIRKIVDKETLTRIPLIVSGMSWSVWEDLDDLLQKLDPDYDG